jgi:hypothetical protein
LALPRRHKRRLPFIHSDYALFRHVSWAITLCYRCYRGSVMTKIVLPLLALLALLGGAAAQTPRPTAPGNSGPRAQRAPTAAAIAALQKQRCQDEYAHVVGDLAYLEARLSLTSVQQPLFDRWKTIKQDNARRDAADCATRELPRLQGRIPTPLEGMVREQENLKRRLANLDAEIPVLTTFYNALSQTQKDALFQPQAMLARRRAMASALATRSGRPDGPDQGPNPPPP